MTAAADLRSRVSAWIAADPDPATRAELNALLSAATPRALADLEQRFATSLVFGTAGLRGPLRAGPNGMNRAVVRRAAAGLAAYLDGGGRSGPVVIGYDARFGSADFARDTAGVLQATGRAALLLPAALPTPVLAFAVRHLHAAAGVMVTASHNPPGDNGYKVYLGGDGQGGQIVPPADRDIEAAIGAVGPAADVPLDGGYQVLGDDVLGAYVDRVVGLLATPGGPDLTIAYTPLHGVGAAVVRAVFGQAGFASLHVVAEQEDPDPRFPTVAFPNPEEPGATDLLLALARATAADLAIANDPDADRCAVIGGGRLLTGDELGVLLADHLMARGTRPGATFASTIVSSSLLGVMCGRRGVPYAETLTGFKWIVRAADDVAYGYEEALGYAVAPDLVRDKDGISAALLVAEMTAELSARGRSLTDRLDELAAEFGLHATDQLSIRVADLSAIAAMMAQIRSAPPVELLGRPVNSVEDLLPAADVVRIRADGVRVVIRPSGTEPKLKAYLEVVVETGEHGPAGVPAAREVAAGQLAEVRAAVAAALAIEPSCDPGAGS
ncbi:MAG: phospho-sugar mutase [Pseudonocardiales bacterium]